MSAKAGPSASSSKQDPFLLRLTEPTSLVMFGAMFIAFGFMFHLWFYNQHRHSWGNGDWSHAYFVPLVSAWLVWQRRAELAAITFKSFWPGLVPLVTGIACYVFFVVGTPNHFGQGLALLLSIFGATLMLLGPRAMPLLFFPIAYLGFGVTVPERVMNFLTFPLQDLAARGGWVMLNLLGVQTDIQGNVLYVLTKDSPVPHPLNVAEQCAGMRMVVGFLALAAAVALVSVKTWWKRVVLFMLAAPVALLVNVVRVAVLGILTLVNPELAAGEAHMWIGTLLLIPGFFLFLGVLWSLNKASPEPVIAKTAKPNAPKGVPA